MFKDFLSFYTHWRLIHLLGVSSLRTRYARSTLGQVWLMLSMFVQILSMSVVWSVLWKMPFTDYLHYMAPGFIFFQFFAQVLQDSSTVLTNDSRLYFNQKIPIFISIYSNTYKNFLILGHNMPLIFGIVLVSQGTFYCSYNFFIGIFLSFIFLVFISYFIAVVCNRYKDMIQVVALVVNMMFLLTPIMWKVDFLSASIRHYMYLNPITCFIEILRPSLIGTPIDPTVYLYIFGWILFSLALFLASYKRMNEKAIIWM